MRFKSRMCELISDVSEEVAVVGVKLVQKLIRAEETSFDDVEEVSMYVNFIQHATIKSSCKSLLKLLVPHWYNWNIYLRNDLVASTRCKGQFLMPLPKSVFTFTIVKLLQATSLAHRKYNLQAAIG